jgi:hypothetical protein
MGKTFSTGLLTNGLWQDSSNNIGIGGSANASFKLQVTGATNLTGALTGTTGSFSVNVSNSNTGLDLTNSGALGYGNSINFYQNASKVVQIFTESSAANTSEIEFRTTVGGTLAKRFKIEATGAATFSSSVTATSLNLVKNDNGTGAIASFAANNLTQQVEIWYAGIKMGGTSTDVGLYLSSKNAGHIYFETNSTERMRIRSDGNVGIGIVGAGDVRLFIKSAGSGAGSYNLYTRNSSNTDLFVVRDDGYINMGLAVSSPYNYIATGRTAILDSIGSLGYLVSTRESKANIESIKNIDFIKKLNPVQFNYRKKDNKTKCFTDEVESNLTYGFIADEVEAVNKELVFYDNLEDGSKKLAGVEYNSMIAILTKAVQELTQKVNALENK